MESSLQNVVYAVVAALANTLDLSKSALVEEEKHSRETLEIRVTETDMNKGTVRWVVFTEFLRSCVLEFRKGFENGRDGVWLWTIEGGLE